MVIVGGRGDVILKALKSLNSNKLQSFYDPRRLEIFYGMYVY